MFHDGEYQKIPWPLHYVKIFRVSLSLSVRKLLKYVSKYLKSSVCDETLVVCLLTLDISLQALQAFLSHKPPVEVESVDMVVKVVRYVKYFTSSLKQSLLIVVLETDQN